MRFEASIIRLVHIYTHFDTPFAVHISFLYHFSNKHCIRVSASNFLFRSFVRKYLLFLFFTQKKNCRWYNRNELNWLDCDRMQIASFVEFIGQVFSVYLLCFIVFSSSSYFVPWCLANKKCCTSRQKRPHWSI